MCVKKNGSSAESVGGFGYCGRATVDFFRHGSGVQWGRIKAALAR